MTKPPSKPKPEPLTTKESATAEARGRTPLVKATMLEHLFANPQAYTDEEIKVWVQAHLPDHREGFHDALTQYLDEIGFFSSYHEVLQVSEAAPLSAGQYFMIFRASDVRNIRLEFGRVSPHQPTLVFEGVVFNTYHGRQEYFGLKLGSSRLWEAAAKRVLQQTGGRDWFGGIAEFAAKYLEQPQDRTKILH